jgi:hypothetical protein
MSKNQLKIGWEVEVKNQIGKTLVRKRGTSKSLLKNFMLWLQQWFTMTTATGFASNWTASDTSNTSRTFPYASSQTQGSFGYFGAGANMLVIGLRVGSGTQAVSPNDYELQTLITHGTSSGQLIYNAQTVEAVTVVGQTASFRVTRTFTNNSGGSVTVREIGAAFDQRDTSGADRYICYLRDVLPAAVTVPDGSTFTLRYTFSVTA